MCVLPGEAAVGHGTYLLSGSDEGQFGRCNNRATYLRTTRRVENHMFSRFQFLVAQIPDIPMLFYSKYKLCKAQKCLH